MSVSTTRRLSSLSKLIDEREQLKQALFNVNESIAAKASTIGVGAFVLPSGGRLSISHIEKEAVRWKEIAIKIDEKRARRMAQNAAHTSTVEYWQVVVSD
jgi:hypothetical protein